VIAFVHSQSLSLSFMDLGSQLGEGERSRLERREARIIQLEKPISKSFNSRTHPQKGLPDRRSSACLEVTPKARAKRKDEK